jgi:hypothetical protein
VLIKEENIFKGRIDMKGKLIVASVCIWFLACGFGGPAPSASSGGAPSASSNIYMIDDFENGNYTTNPVWWKFDNITPSVVDNADYQSGDPAILKGIGKYSLNITGNAKDWYAGGMGTYIAKKNNDLGRYNAVQMDVFGNGPGSGTIKIEAVDDDKGNWKVEQDSKGVPLYDDMFVYNMMVDWSGWKRVAIPFSDFTLDNPGKGDGILTVSQENGKGGLLQMQFIFIAPKQTGSLKYNLDNISLTRK